MRDGMKTVALSFASLMTTMLPLQAHAAPPGDLSAAARAELLRASGVTCKANARDDCTAGNVDSGDYYNVRIYGDCTAEPYYGRTDGKPVPLRTRVATTGYAGTNLGTLPPNQLVCIRAAAQVKQTDLEYFVMALPLDTGLLCGHGKLCRKIAWPARFEAAMRGCIRSRVGTFTGCPQGWVSAEEMEAYPNGL